ncbi:MAG: bifunctional diaminohydroxyphosphoribosylaminopyrimidine deaminase/5-amino-6-(5-phosphoribosylamino)uracil reductase RibD, partial [Candidatus Omnitrophica bacterium]|nr:bifunctional diaminohydroxyphosphoribosylaminopyrimidine deaminase/5-amino-6-(5-phosphoribosylamino)uracil reductase RibD [Candidatus Omnitrophota bacterium]
MLKVESKQDLYFLKKTFSLAKRAEGFTSPNPLVGALFVKKNKILSFGYHRKSGGPHAEVEAIRVAKKSLSGSTLYINLEPCCHFGRTGPCVDEIIKRGIKRAVIATADPNPKVNRKSIRKLRKAGIKVEVGLCKKEAEKLNETFFKNIREKKPFVVAKVAQSLDGKIATQKGISQWITSSSSRKFSKKLRDRYDCVLIGANTLIKDNPGLDGLDKSPFKAVISPRLNIPLDSYLLKNNPHKLIIFTSDKSRFKRKKISSEVKVFFLKEEKGWLPVKKILKILYSLGIMSVFIEGGSQTIGQFFIKREIDKVFFFIAPKIIG